MKKIIALAIIAILCISGVFGITKTQDTKKTGITKAAASSSKSSTKKSQKKKSQPTKNKASKSDYNAPKYKDKAKEKPKPVEPASPFDIKNGILREYDGADSQVIIPDNVTVIGEGAFENCDYVESVIIPEGVLTIDDGAFLDCDNLKTISIPNSVKKIKQGAFGECGKLEAISIPEGVTEIPDFAFYKCTSLRSVSAGNVKIIGSGAFAYCSSLKNMVIPESVKTLGVSCFAFSGLETISVSGNAKDIPEGAFAGCQSLKKAVLGDGMEGVGDHAFNDCKKLSEISIADSVKIIGSEAFSNCVSLKELVLPKELMNLSETMFSGCDLEKVTCNGDYAGIVCSLLPNLKTVELGPDVSEIEAAEFVGCMPKDLTVSDDNPNFTVSEQVLFDKDMTHIIMYFGDGAEYAVPESVTSIGDYAFAESSISQIEIHSGVKEIAKTALKRAVTVLTVKNSAAAIYAEKNGNKTRFTDLEKAAAERKSADGKAVHYSSAAAKAAEIGSELTFGKYQIASDEKEPIVWIVVNKESDKVTLISKYALDCYRYSTAKGSTNWEKSSLRAWLNSEFYKNAFGEEDVSLICDNTVKQESMPGIDCGGTTADKVYCLSRAEANKFFKDNAKRKSIATVFAKKNGVYEDDDNEGCWWWLRSVSGTKGNVSVVNSDGKVNTGGLEASNKSVGVRPVICLKL